MKKMLFALMMMLTATLSASAMSYEQARNEALFLTDKMAYELNLTDAQYEAAYEINLDYLMGVTSYDDVYGIYWERRNADLNYILYSWQWDLFRAATYFYRPLYWDAGHWHFGVYARYPRRDYFYFGRPHFYATYRGGHSWHMNGGRSYYHGRSNHFRPTLGANRQHYGMRNSFDRGNHNNGRNFRGGNSSTRVTAGRNGMRPVERNYRLGEGSRQLNENRGRSLDTRSSFGNERRTTTTTTTRSTTTPSRSFSGNRSTTTTTTTRSTTTGPSRPTTSGPSRSFGGSRNSAAPTRSHSAPSRSAGGSTGGSRSNSHGHFGGSRN